MRIALVIRPFTDENLQTALQMGVEDVVTVLPNAGPVWDYLAILRHKKRIEDQGLRWSVVESVPISDNIKLGLEGRDQRNRPILPDHSQPRRSGHSRNVLQLDGRLWLDAYLNDHPHARQCPRQYLRSQRHGRRATHHRLRRHH